MRNASAPLLKLRNLKIRTAGKYATAGALTLLLAAITPTRTQNAIANGDTRTIHLYHTHSGESIQATFRVNGQYDTSVLEKLNHFLRDWRNDETIKMDPRLFDVVWETYRESGSQEPINIVSAYRSPQTNAMLRRRSKAVAEFSQHMLGKAMDMHYLDVPMSRVREIAMRLQRGGVGYYPTAGTPFVHLDVGNVRAWPRMSYEQLAHLFPDGKTVHLPPSGQPLARYEEARAEIETRGGVSSPSVAQVQSKGFFATLFGGGDDDETEVRAPRGGPRSRVASYVDSRNQPKAQVASATYDDNNSASYFLAEANRSPVIRQAQRNLPRGETYAAPTPTVAPAPTAAPFKPAPVQTAFLPAAPLPPSRPTEAFAAFDPRAVDAPVPPRRPTDPPLLGQLAAFNAPLPPSRPAELRLSAPRTPEPRIAELRLGDEQTRIARPADLPPVITGAGAAPPLAPALAYAPILEAPTPIARPMAAPPRPIARAPASRSNLVAAKVDRSTLTALIRTVSVAQLPEPAKAHSGANRAEMTRTIFAQPTPASGGFNKADAGLSTGSFSGKAVVAVTARDMTTLAKRQD